MSERDGLSGRDGMRGRQVFYIDLAGVETREELYDRIGRELPLPAYCGRNADALHDVLTSELADTLVIFYNIPPASAAAGKALRPLQRMAEDLAREGGAELRFYP